MRESGQVGLHASYVRKLNLWPSVFDVTALWLYKTTFESTSTM
jgi:hypothetical protein